MSYDAWNLTSVDLVKAAKVQLYGFVDGSKCNKLWIFLLNTILYFQSLKFVHFSAYVLRGITDKPV